MKKPADSKQISLLIDTTSTNSTNVAVIKGRQFFVVKRAVRAQGLQQMITEVLKRANISIEQLDTIAVLVGPGSYTGTRMGAVTANTIKWLTDVTITEIPGTDFDAALQQLTGSNTLKSVRIAKARY